MERNETPPTSFFLKRGTLIGAAIGMLAGMVSLGIQGVEPDAEAASIIVWRNFILIGAAFGFFLGGGVSWWIRCRKEPPNTPHKPDPQTHASQSSS